jgi:hypothetical protein
VNDLTEGFNGEKLRAALGSCLLEAHSFMVQRRLSVGGSDSRALRRDASWQGAQGGGGHKGSASRRQSVSLREAATMSRRRVAGDIKDRQVGLR